MKKKCLLIAAAVILGLLLCAWGYWEYLGYKFDKDPQYYYKPRTIHHSCP